MNLSMRWLGDYVQLDKEVSPRAFSAALTMSGSKVEGYEVEGSEIKNVVVGKVLSVDKGVTMGDLKGTLEIFVKKLYGEDAQVRFRPHHFPFTEPSAEMDVMCFNCHGEGCRLCKNEGWIEILGCGMVHPKVLRGCGIDPEVYSGFAFGMGLERIVMRRFNIDDLRLFYENDMRFLDQF